MANIISVLNGKGGVGKSTISINLARSLQAYGKVLLVDTDPQGTTRNWSECNDEMIVPVVAMEGTAIERDLVQVVSESFDWVVIDGAGKLDKSTLSHIKISDFILIIVQPSQADFWATAPIVELIKARQEVTDGSPVAAFQINRAKKGTKLRSQAADITKYGLPIMDGYIHDRTVFASVLSDGVTVLDRDKNSPASSEINFLAKQLYKAFN